MKKKDTKEADLLFFKQFREISIKNVCTDLKITYENVISGKASSKTIHKVRIEIDRRLEILRNIKD